MDSRPPKSPARLVAAFGILQAAIAVGTYGLFVWADRHRDDTPALRSMDRLLMFGDVPGYFNNAKRAFEGRIPYWDDPIEYPVLALPFLYLPRVFTSHQKIFITAFAAEMMLVNALTLGLIAWWVRRDEGPSRVLGRLLWSTAFFAPICPFIAGRFDAVPAAFAFASACAWFSGRWATGGTLAGLGTLVKIIPGAVALPGMILEVQRLRKSRGRGTIAFFASLVAGVAFWLAIGGTRVLDSVRYHTDRGLELGSIYSGALRLLAHYRGAEVWVYHANVCENLGSSWSASVAKLAMPIQAAALLLVAWRCWKSGGRDPLRWSAAAVLAFASTGKVLSPQYLVWIAPFVVALGGPTGRIARPAFLVACLANVVIYPWVYHALIRLDLGVFVVLNVRNALLLGIFGLLLFGPEARSAAGTLDGSDRDVLG